MTDQIQGLGSMAGMGSFQSSQPLTSDQKTQLQSILQNYDPTQLTASDAKSIFKSIRDAGIQPGASLQATLKAAGFDPAQLRSLAGPQGHHGGHHHAAQAANSSQDSSSTIDVSKLQSLESILGQYDLNNLSTDQQTSMMSQLNQSGLLSTGSTINLSA